MKLYPLGIAPVLYIQTVKFKAEIHLLLLCIILASYTKTSARLGEGECLIHKASCKKAIVAETWELAPTTPHDIAKAASLPANIAVAQEPKEIEPILKAGQYC